MEVDHPLGKEVMYGVHVASRPSLNFQWYVLGNHRTRRFKKADLDSVPRPLGAPVPRKRHRGINLAEVPVLAELWENEKDAAYDAE